MVALLRQYCCMPSSAHICCGEWGESCPWDTLQPVFIAAFYYTLIFVTLYHYKFWHHPIHILLLLLLLYNIFLYYKLHLELITLLWEKLRQFNGIVMVLLSKTITALSKK